MSGAPPPLQTSHLKQLESNFKGALRNIHLVSNYRPTLIFYASASDQMISPADYKGTQSLGRRSGSRLICWEDVKHLSLFPWASHPAYTHIVPPLPVPLIRGL